MHEPVLIKTLCERGNYDRYRKYVKEYATLPETYEFIEDIGAWFEAHPGKEHVEWPEFMAWSLVARHPTWTEVQRRAYSAIVETVAKQPSNPAVINRINELAVASDIKEFAEDAMAREGTGSFDKIVDSLDTYREFMKDGGAEDPLAPYDLRDIFESLERKGGLQWRLNELNKSVGPVCRGDLVIVGKRPEVGGTTFLASEMTHMLSQMPDGSRAVLFNNEESRHKVTARVIQSALNRTVMDMASDPTATLDDWSKFLGTKHFDVVHDTSLSTRTVESVLRRHEYGLIGINVLWKLDGFRKLEVYERYQRLCQWARGLADKHAPVVGIWQVDGSGEGVPWLNQSQLYMSKTGAQGEADVLLMIGASHEPGKGDERYISVVKNKTPSSSMTDPRLRHGQFTVGIDAERGRFLSRLKP